MISAGLHALLCLIGLALVVFKMRFINRGYTSLFDNKWCWRAYVVYHGLFAIAFLSGIFRVIPPPVEPYPAEWFMRIGGCIYLALSSWSVLHGKRML